MRNNNIYRKWSQRPEEVAVQLQKMVELHRSEFMKRAAYDYILTYLSENNTDVERVAHIIANIDELTCKDCKRVHAHCSCVPF